jgi:hypothetical protein
MKISKEEIRKRLQQQEQKKQTEETETRKTVEKKPARSQRKETILIKELKNLGLITALILLVMVGSVLLKEKTGLLDQFSNYLFQLFNLS